MRSRTSPDLIPRATKTEIVEYKGRKALHIITQSENGSGITLVKGEEAYFSNLKITPTLPETIQNGSEPAGTWDVSFSTDAGSMKVR